VSEQPGPPRPIQPDDDVGSFACGNEALDNWLKNVAIKAEARTARTYVVCVGREVIGYYSLVTGGTARAAAPGTLRRNAPDPLPVLIIARFAVASRMQKRGIGESMLRDAFRRSLQASEIVGFRTVLVHAIDDVAARFYRKYGFAPFPGEPLTLFLPLDQLRPALDAG
jgi:GNAT superfamily N-acetyltransferase